MLQGGQGRTPRFLLQRTQLPLEELPLHLGVLVFERLGCHGYKLWGRITLLSTAMSTSTRFLRLVSLKVQCLQDRVHDWVTKKAFADSEHNALWKHHLHWMGPSWYYVQQSLSQAVGGAGVSA